MGLACLKGFRGVALGYSAGAFGPGRVGTNTMGVHMTKTIRNSVIVLMSAGFLAGCATYDDLSPAAKIGLGVLGALVIYKAVEHEL